MQALNAALRPAFHQPAGASVLPRRSALLALLVSSDAGRTWQLSGTLGLPTDRYDAVARLFLMTAMSTSANEGVTQVVWQAQVWAVDEGEAPTADTPPVVSLRSDGQLPQTGLSHQLPSP
ncbi:hypothetical protein ACIBK9_25565 [Nonomuraea sp. NPDC050227]|uniref:hypothetical protein n=1 Tax=Nonomuraea sp. NPDC050227 TaxID=3364360 RepID=UPI0037952A38